MKKILFGLILFFVCITPSFAKEIDFKGNKIDIDVDTYPYYFIGEGNGKTLIDYYVVTCNHEFYVGNKTSDYVYFYTSGSACNYTNYFTNGNKYSSNFISNTSFNYRENMEYISSFDLKNSNDEVIFKLNIKNTLGKFPININKVSLSHIENTTSKTDELYSRVLNYIKEYPDECKYYYIRGVDNLYFDGYGNQDVIELKCFDSSYQFNLCPVKASFGDYISISTSKYHNSRIDFGYNNFFDYGSSDSYFVYGFDNPKENLQLWDGNNLKNMYILTNIDTYTFDCSTSYYPEKDWYDSINYKGKEYSIGSSIKFEDISKVPKLEYEITKKKFDEEGKIISKTIKFSFDIYNVDKYKYYFSYDGSQWFDFVSNNFTVTYDKNTILYFKVLDRNGSELGFYTYEIKDINVEPKVDLNGNVINKDVFGEYESEDNYYEILDDVEDETTMSKLFNNISAKFTLFIDTYFGIFKQLYGFYNLINSYEETTSDMVYVEPTDCHFSTSNGVAVGSLDVDNITYYDCPSLNLWGYYNLPDVPVLDLGKIPFLKSEQKFILLDTSLYASYRETIFMWFYLILGTYTLFKVSGRAISALRNVFNV